MNFENRQWFQISIKFTLPQDSHHTITFFYCLKFVLTSFKILFALSICQNQCCLMKWWKNKWKIHCFCFGTKFFCLFFMVITCINSIHNHEWHKKCYITKLTTSIKEVNAKFQTWNVVANNGIGERILQSLAIPWGRV